MKNVLIGLGALVALVLLVLLVAFVVLRAPDLSQDALVEKYGGPPSFFVDLPNQGRVHVRDQGNPDGETLLLLHGSNSSLHTWEPWAGLLGDAYRVVSLCERL